MECVSLHQLAVGWWLVNVSFLSFFRRAYARVVSVQSITRPPGALTTRKKGKKTFGEVVKFLWLQPRQGSARFLSFALESAIADSEVNTREPAYGRNERKRTSPEAILFVM